MTDLDLLLNGALIATALTMIGPFWRARDTNPASLPGAGLFAAVAAFAMLRVLAAADVRPVWIVLFQAVAVAGPFFFWRLVRTVFEDGFTPRPWHWAMLVALEALMLVRMAPGGEFAGVLGRALGATIVLHALWILWRGARGDMVEARLRARWGLILLAGALALLTLSRPWVALAAPGLARILAQVTPLLNIVLILAAGRLFFRVDRELWPVERLRRAAATTQGHDPEGEDLARLDSLMREAEVWREPGLTIARLAERAAIPEYRLRRLILERRGARNFNAYLTQHRIEAAAAILGDPALTRVPVTSVAYDCGFASLGPFNRAFRERFGLTPTAYRRGERVTSAHPEHSPIS